MKPQELIKKIQSGTLDNTFRLLYGTSPETMAVQKQRYTDAVEAFISRFPDRTDVSLFSAPGRSEIGGNHTDHQHGCVLAAAVNLDVIAVVAFHDEGVIRLLSKGYPEDKISLSDLSVQPDENGTSAAIIRGIAAKFAETGVKISGFDAYTTSDVLSGSGLSSSAAFEVLIGTIIDKRFNGGKAGAVEIAKISQYAENMYFGKNCGLMDQIVSSVGGFVCIDFFSPEQPKIKNHIFSFEQAGYCLCITDTKGSHANLTPDYAAVPQEMRHVAEKLGKSVLRDVDEDEFYRNLPELRHSCTDREILRAAHFFAENKRAVLESDAVADGRLDDFFALVRESGDSSANLLQNIYSCGSPSEQGISLAIMLSKRILGGRGAVRVHGGGFAGTIQAFVPVELAEAYSREMNRIFGENSCYILRIRPIGGIELTGQESR